MILVLAISKRLGVFRSLCDETSALLWSPGLVLLISLFSDGIGVPLDLTCGVDHHRPKYQLCAKVGSSCGGKGGLLGVWCCRTLFHCSSTF